MKEYSRFHGYAYDGIWAIALAIQAVDKKLRMRNSPLTIEDFQYRDPFWAELFREALNETHFDGVTVSLLSLYFSLFSYVREMPSHTTKAKFLWSFSFFLEECLIGQIFIHIFRFIYTTSHTHTHTHFFVSPLTVEIELK